MRTIKHQISALLLIVPDLDATAVAGNKYRECLGAILSEISSSSWMKESSLYAENRREPFVGQAERQRGGIRDLCYL
ncbi:hypothetical protein [Sphingobacterium faecale]|uniref:Uncharacterized protein n=1 Tax=Sphingobacterium faecale TaxID=2803775 RepID=A0ABS1R8H4_9SPHI|nr:hypothetical protein [Sphingobacterium faecale]MBL1410978.1 hypothetical protein [Sphingobacterium faecale]